MGGAEQHTPEQPASPAREPLAEEIAVVVGSSKKRKRKIERQLPKRTRKFSVQKGSRQGSQQPTQERRVRYEKLPLIDTDNLHYEGELADRHAAISGKSLRSVCGNRACVWAPMFIAERARNLDPQTRRRRGPSLLSLKRASNRFNFWLVPGIPLPCDAAAERAGPQSR